VILRRLLPEAVDPIRRSPVDPEALRDATPIVEDVRARGEAALREHAERLGDLAAGAPLFRSKDELKLALASLPADQRGVLERTAVRIRAFAEAQKESLQALEAPVPGGRAGHSIEPVERAGCYAPGGRFPLPSSVLMTAAVAKVAGVPEVWVASPKPSAVTLAAAAVAGADGFLAAGGAQAIAAMAYGAGRLPPMDAIVGPGNRWVTAAKSLVAGRVAIDMLAGPSELVIVADGSADAGVIAADLLAQAEHDPDALPVLISTDPALLDRVDLELDAQLATLPTAPVARLALEHGFSVLAPSAEAALDLADRLGPEHLEIQLEEKTTRPLRHYGALFVGAGSAEVFGDYGIGPNHVLPTGGTARSSGGLSVLTFLRVRTWLEVVPEPSMIEDAAALARMEGLEAHARAAERRRSGNRRS
jgi:phosphoribosyl-ATP pyrophosphohydrolase/phosphoribosyl-AMP cyclohydrolase/histidinol dehydrogenase